MTVPVLDALANLSLPPRSAAKMRTVASEELQALKRKLQS